VELTEREVLQLLLEALEAAMSNVYTIQQTVGLFSMPGKPRLNEYRLELANILLDEIREELQIFQEKIFEGENVCVE